MDLRITVDDEALRFASGVTGIRDPQALLTHLLREFVRSETAKQLIARGGQYPDAKAPPRRRPPDFLNDDQASSPND